ncbi:MAG: MFS transporter [Alphaproteobacteria bacterium]
MNGFWQALTADRKVGLAIIVAALGYFVDIFDLILFTILRVDSLKSIGVTGDALLTEGVFLLNMQMIGMLVGGLLWGIIGDKRGRIVVLFGSILMYSLANIANAFVTDVWQYAVCRFIAGIGLAGEIGAGVTLVAEIMPKKTRGYGTTIIAVVGVLGTLAAGLIGDLVSWQNAYIIGGVMGLALLALRMSVHESGLFKHSAAQKNVQHGDVRLILGSRQRFGRYMLCVMIGVPLWFVVGVLVAFTPEIGVAMGIPVVLKASYTSMLYYAGLAIGNLCCGVLSERLQSRKLAIGSFLISSFVVSLALLLSPIGSAKLFYAMFFPLGFCGGFWIVYLTAVAEQFGTNLRATVTTSVPNFVRGATVPITLGFTYLMSSLGVLGSATAVCVVVFVLGIMALWRLQESYGVDLDFVETPSGTTRHMDQADADHVARLEPEAVRSQG